MSLQAERAAPSRHALEISRIFDAPRSLVFGLWTRPEHLARWWGPKDFSVPSVSLDFRPGGKYRHAIRSADGIDHWMQGVYREIVEPERIVFTFAWEDVGGSPQDWTLVTVNFEDMNGKTRLTFRQESFDTREQRDSHQAGWGECLDRLQSHVAASAAQRF